MLYIFNKVQVVSSMLFFNMHIQIIYAEVFTAVTELEYLLLPHKTIITDLEHYVNIQEKKLSLLKRYLDLFITEHKKVMEDCNLNNSLHIYTLIKRLVYDLDYLPVINRIGAEYMSNFLVKHTNVTYPEQQDLVGAAHALTRLQKLYYLNVKDLANGNLNNLAYSTPMTAGDCFEVALVLESEDYKSGHTWMMEAKRKYNEENVSYPFTDFEILKYLSISSGDTTSSLGSTKTILDPKESAAIEMMQIYENNIPELAGALEMEREMKQQIRTEEEGKMYMKYEAMCRGELTVPTQISNRLKCRYLTESNPFLKLAPFKVEMMYLNPDVVLFHDVLSDSEIEIIKQITRPNLERAKVNNYKTGYLRNARFRISKVAWLEYCDSPITELITRRVAHMTGLVMGSPQQFQVVNYGIGGHYEPHFDFTKKEEKIAQYQTAATVLFYAIDISSAKQFADTETNREGLVIGFHGLIKMSDVAQGGATVFPELGVRLLPAKGTAVLWFNLHASLEGNYAMRHAACPVLQGDKWVFSRFVSMKDQIFVKPCNLEYQQEGFYKKILHPVPKINS